MISFTPIIVKYVKKNLDIMKPRYNEQILSVPWSFVKSRFHCIIVSLWAWYLFWWDSQFIQLPLSEASGLSSAIVSVMLKV